VTNHTMPWWQGLGRGRWMVVGCCPRSANPTGDSAWGVDDPGTTPRKAEENLGGAEVGVVGCPIEVVSPVPPRDVHLDLEYPAGQGSAPGAVRDPRQAAVDG
jgi:hypothetical protein